MYLNLYTGVCKYPSCFKPGLDLLTLQALASLAEAAFEACGGEEEPDTYLLSPHFGDLIQQLVKTADR